jgi:hypothetical protein
LEPIITNNWKITYNILVAHKQLRLLGVLLIIFTFQQCLLCKGALREKVLLKLVDIHASTNMLRDPLKYSNVDFDRESGFRGVC